MAAPDLNELSITLAVLDTRVEHLTEKADERHEALLESLNRIEGALTPLSKRVGDLERIKSQALAVVGAGSVVLSGILWLVDKVLK